MKNTAQNYCIFFDCARVADILPTRLFVFAYFCQSASAQAQAITMQYEADCYIMSVFPAGSQDEEPPAL